MLMGAAITQDSSTGRGSRRANMHESSIIHDDPSEDELNDDETTELLINRIESRPRLPDEIFSSFDANDRKQWIGLSREAKQRIVDQLSGSSSSKQNKRIQAHASTQLPSSHDDTSDTDVNPTDYDNSDPQSDATSTILTNVANTNPVAHPGDPRRVLAKQATSKPKSPSTLATTSA